MKVRTERARDSARAIRWARARLGCTQAELAMAAGFDQPMIAKWEKGWHVPSERNKARLERELGVKLP